MKYTEARPKIRSGDLIATSHGKSMFSSWRDFKIQMVRIFTKSEYSHVATAWVIGERVFVIEAVQPKVRIYPLSKILVESSGFYWVPMNAPWKESTLTLALSCVGDPYSQLQAMEAYFQLPREDSLWECAELARTIAKCDGVDLGFEATPAKIMHRAITRSGILHFVE